MSCLEQAARPAVADGPFADDRVARPTSSASSRRPEQPVPGAAGRTLGVAAQTFAVAPGNLPQRLAQLEAAHAELQATAAAVAHDLRTPLAQIEGFAEMLVEGGHGLDTDGRRQIDVVTRVARRMNRMVVDLLELAHVDTTPMRRMPVPLDRVVARLRTTRPAAAGEAGAIEWSIGDLPSVCGDSTLLGLAFEQLVNEAVRYSGSRNGSQVRVESVESAAVDEAVIAVDAKPGSLHPTAGVPRLLPPQPANAAGRPAGSAMGMALVRRVAARHGGRTWAESPPGGGVRFFIALPV